MREKLVLTAGPLVVAGSRKRTNTYQYWRLQGTAKQPICGISGTRKAKTSHNGVTPSRMVPHLVLTLEVFEESLIEIGRNAVEQRPQDPLRELVVVQILYLHIRVNETHVHYCGQVRRETE